MTDSKLPTIRSKSSLVAPENTAVETIKGIRTNRLLMAGGLAATAGATGIFILTQHIIFSVLLAVIAVIFFGSRQLIKKSLELTSNTNQPQLGSTQSQLEQIKKQVSKCKFLENVEVEGTQAASQADQLIQQYKSLKNILSEKFEPSEITFSRYLNSIETSCLSIGENLIHIKSILENLNLTSKNQTEQWKEQQGQVSTLLASTDEALRELAQLFNSVNEITTKEKHRDQLEQSIQQIKELADRAKIYSKH